METEGDASGGVMRESLLDPTRSETPSTHRCSMHGTWEILPACGEQYGRHAQGTPLAISLSGMAAGSRTAE